MEAKAAYKLVHVINKKVLASKYFAFATLEELRSARVEAKWSEKQENCVLRIAEGL